MLEEAGSGLTDMAMNTARTNGDANLLVTFHRQPKLIAYKSEQEGRPIYEERDYVRIMQPGNKDSIINRPATAMDKQRFAEQYAKYQARESQEAVEGTLLEEWPGVTRSQVEELKYLNIRTVEQLSAVSDSNAQGILGVNMLRDKAKRYLETSEKEANAEKLAKYEARINELSTRLDELGSENRVLKDIAPEPKKRGRPRKTAEE